MVIRPLYDKVSEFHEGLAIVGNESNGKVFWSVINKNGLVVVKDLPYATVYNYRNGLAQVTTADSATGFIDAKGRLVIPLTGRNYGIFAQGRCSFNSEGSINFGFIDLGGNVVIPPKFKYVGAFSEDLCNASVMVDGIELFGYIDRLGKWVITPQFLKAGDFHGGLAPVCLLNREKFEQARKEDRDLEEALKTGKGTHFNPPISQAVPVH